MYGRPPRPVLGGIISCLSLSVAIIRAADNTACMTSELDWYTSVVGETPCTTYQRLQQICWEDYEVPVLGRNPPGTTCSLPGGRIPDCCCNTVSWYLSMLCLNCQSPTGSNIDTIDPSAYTAYLSGCTGNSPPDTSKALKLTDGVQTAICERGIRIDNYLYDFPWAHGIWYYGWASTTMQEEHAKENDQSFTHCSNNSVLLPSSISSVITSTRSEDPSPTMTVTSSVKSKPAVGFIIGEVVGGLAALLGIGVGCFLVGRRLGLASREYDERQAPSISSALSSTPILAASYPRPVSSASTSSCDHTASSLIFCHNASSESRPWAPSQGSNSVAHSLSTSSGILGGLPPSYSSGPIPSG